jgi:hypothetical protein
LPSHSVCTMTLHSPRSISAQRRPCASSIVRGAGPGRHDAHHRFGRAHRPIIRRRFPRGGIAGCAPPDARPLRSPRPGGARGALPPDRESTVVGTRAHRLVPGDLVPAILARVARAGARPRSSERADRLFDSSAVAHDTRWHLELPSRAGIHAYMANTFDRTIEALERVPAGRDRYFFELALLHEDMHGEALLMTLQTLGLPPPELPGARATCLEPGSGSRRSRSPADRSRWEARRTRIASSSTTRSGATRS